MADTKRQFELDYWRLAGLARGCTPNQEYLRLFGSYVPNCAGKTVLEIGPGPLDGVLHDARFAASKSLTALDPLYHVYGEQGWLPEPGPIERVVGVATDLPCDAKYDLVIAFNSLDHHPLRGGDCVANIRAACRAVGNGGRLLLYMHLRSADQLDIGHDHALTEYDVFLAAHYYGLRVMYAKLHSRDRINNGRWTTLQFVGDKQ